MRACSGSASAWRWPRRCCSRSCRGCRRRRVRGPRPVERQRADHAGHQPPAARVRGDADRRVVRAARRRRHAADDAARAAAARTGFEHAQRARVNVPVVSYGRKPNEVALLQGSDAAHRRAARRRARRGRHGRAVARRRAAFGPGQFTVEGYAGERRRGSARAVPHGLAGLLRRARRADHRRPRLHRRDRAAPRARRHRQPEPRAADVPEPGRGEPPPDVDRSGDEVHRRQHRPRAASSASSPTSTTRTSCPAGDDGLSPVRAGDRRRPAVRARAGDPYALVPPITRIIRELSPDQPVERAATLEDVRAEVLAPSG
jgi:hypothetical protein